MPSNRRLVPGVAGLVEVSTVRGAASCRVTEVNRPLSNPSVVHFRAGSP